MKVTTHFHLLAILRMYGLIPPFYWMCVWHCVQAPGCLYAHALTGLRCMFCVVRSIWFSIGWIMDSDFSMWWWSQCIDYCIQLHFVPSCHGTSRSKHGSSNEAVWSRYCLSSCHSLPGMMCFVHRAVILKESSGEHMKEKMSLAPFLPFFSFIKKVLVLRSIAYCHKIEMLVVYSYIMWCGNVGFIFVIWHIQSILLIFARGMGTGIVQWV